MGNMFCKKPWIGGCQLLFKTLIDLAQCRNTVDRQDYGLYSLQYLTREEVGQ